MNRTKKSEKTRAKQRKPYVGDVGYAITRPDVKMGVSFGMILLALAIGFVIGFLVWAALWLASAVTGVVWLGVNEGTAPWYMPIILCTVGGLAIGLWSKYVGGDPAPLEEVLSEVRKTGGYKLKSIPASVVGFLLPLAFGGSVGLEAGLTGLIAAGCTYIGTTLKRAGLRVKSIADVTVSAALTAIFGTPLAGIVVAAEDASPLGDSDDAAAVGEEDASAGKGGNASSEITGGKPLLDPDKYTFRRAGKLALYAASAFGAIGGIFVLGNLVGGMTGIPRFDAIEATGADLLWFIPCVAFAYGLTVLHHVSQHAFSRLGKRFDRYTVLRPLLCGLCIGVIALWLPDVLFCGEEQGFELKENWSAMGAAILLLTGIVKVPVTTLCLNMGWRGGNFFPNIYAGLSCGYGLALLTGADPVLCITVVTSAFISGMLRKPLIALALLVLCFPVSGIIWMGLACVLGAALPVPRRFLREGNDSGGAEK